MGLEILRVVCSDKRAETLVLPHADKPGSGRFPSPMIFQNKSTSPAVEFGPDRDKGTQTERELL